MKLYKFQLDITQTSILITPEEGDGTFSVCEDQELVKIIVDALDLKEPLSVTYAMAEMDNGQLTLDKVDSKH